MFKKLVIVDELRIEGLLVSKPYRLFMLLEGNELSLKIFDSQGRAITSYHVSKTTAEAGLNHALDNGVYFLQWITDKGEYGVEKVMVMKN